MSVGGWVEVTTSAPSRAGDLETIQGELCLKDLAYVQPQVICGGARRVEWRVAHGVVSSVWSGEWRMV